MHCNNSPGYRDTSITGQEHTPLFFTYLHPGRTNPPPPTPWWEHGQSPATAKNKGFKDPGKLREAQLLLDPACALAVEGDLRIHGHLGAPFGSQHAWIANTQQWEFLTKLFSLSVQY